MPETTTQERASRKPDLTGPRVIAYKGVRKDQSEYLAVYVPGLEPIYLNKVPDEKRTKGEQSPRYAGLAGVVFVNHAKEGGKAYLSAKLEGFAKAIPLFEADDERAS